MSPFNLSSGKNVKNSHLLLTGFFALLAAVEGWLALLERDLADKFTCVHKKMYPDSRYCEIIVFHEICSNLLRLRRPGTRDWLGLELKVEMGMDMAF